MSDHGLSHPFKGPGAVARVLTGVKLCLLSVSYRLLSHNSKHLSTITSICINAYMTTSDHGLSQPFKSPAAVASVLTGIKLCFLSVSYRLLSHNSKHVSTITSICINAYMTTSDHGLSQPFKSPAAVASVLTGTKLCFLSVSCRLLSHNSLQIPQISSV